MLLASTSAFAPGAGPSNHKNLVSKNTDLSCATTEKIQRLSERSESIPLRSWMERSWIPYR